MKKKQKLSEEEEKKKDPELLNSFTERCLTKMLKEQLWPGRSSWRI